MAAQRRFPAFFSVGMRKAGLEMQGFPVGPPLPPQRSSWMPKGGGHWRAFSGASGLYDRRLTERGKYVVAESVHVTPLYRRGASQMGLHEEV